MCRFVIARFDTPEDPLRIIEAFSGMCRKSRSPDGDRQEDGWGAAWLNEEDDWSVRKSTLPIWMDTFDQKNIPKTRMMALHARSASFPHHRDEISFNQPFIAGGFAFVFNGLIRGVRLPETLPGRIGSQKIWFLLQGLLKTYSAPEALNHLNQVLEKHSREVMALNVGLCRGDKMTVLNRASRHSDYYRLHMHSRPGLTLLASEPIFDASFSPLPMGRALSL